MVNTHLLIFVTNYNYCLTELEAIHLVTPDSSGASLLLTVARSFTFVNIRGIIQEFWIIKFVYQKIVDQSNSSANKNICPIPVDSAYFCLRLVFETKPVPIATDNIEYNCLKSLDGEA